MIVVLLITLAPVPETSPKVLSLQLDTLNPVPKPRHSYMNGCQNYGPFLDPDYNTTPNIWGTQRGSIILTTTHILVDYSILEYVIVHTGNTCDQTTHTSKP